MIKEKRSRNPPKLFLIQEPVPHAKQKIIEKKRRLSEDNYAVIGLPPKYSSPSDVYLLPGVKNKTLSQPLTFSRMFLFHRGMDYLSQIYLG